MKETIHFGVHLMKKAEKMFPILGPAIAEWVAEEIREYVGEVNLKLLEEELKS